MRAGDSVCLWPEKHSLLITICHARGSDVIAWHNLRRDIVQAVSALCSEKAHHALSCKRGSDDCSAQPTVRHRTTEPKVGSRRWTWS